MEVLEEFGLDVLNKDTIKGYRIIFEQLHSGHPWNALENDEFLMKLRAAAKNKNGTLSPTIAGLLFFGEAYHITEVFPNYFLDYREECDDKAVRWLFRTHSNEGDWSGNIYDFFCKVRTRMDDDVAVLLRSTGMEPDKLSDRAKWLLIARMIPLVENNFNMCELGPRSTGKSYIYEQISPNSILVAGGQTTVANLFYNMSNNTVGLVGMWDVVAFDEVAGIKFKDKDGIQIMKGYMASGAFSRGKAEIQAKASMVFVGNINQSVETLQKTSSLFDPFPPEMGTDTAFLDRFHAYIPGWEIPKYRPDSFTNDYGFITDYLSEFMRELRKDNYSNIAEKYFKLGNNLNQRDAIAVRKLISGFIKLIYPDGEVSKEEVAEIMDISLELRRRVKEQLKKIGGMEFYDVNFSYIDNDSFDGNENVIEIADNSFSKSSIEEAILTEGFKYIGWFFC